MSDTETLRQILTTSRTIAIVGLSTDHHRPSYAVASYLQARGYRIIPVNPKYEEILGERCYPSLTDIPERVDLIDVFRRTEDVAPFARQAVEIGARTLWQQMGVANEEADRIAREAGLGSVMNRCVKTDHMRLIG
jgi:predicted CoA-binding protein